MLFTFTDCFKIHSDIWIGGDHSSSLVNILEKTIQFAAFNDDLHIHSIYAIIHWMFSDVNLSFWTFLFSPKFQVHGMLRKLNKLQNLIQYQECFFNFFFFPNYSIY